MKRFLIGVLVVIACIIACVRVVDYEPIHAVNVGNFNIGVEW